MPSHLPLAALAAGALALSGCAALSSADEAAIFKAGLQHMETCERHYAGATGRDAGLSFRIDCPLQAPRVSAPPAGAL